MPLHQPRHRLRLLLGAGFLVSALSISAFAMAQPQPEIRRYVVKPVTWEKLTFSDAEREYNEDNGKPEYSQRWFKVTLLTNSEVFFSTSLHGVARMRLGAAVLQQVKWENNGQVLEGKVTKELAEALGTSDGMNEIVRSNIGPGMPVQLEAGLNFSISGNPDQSRLTFNPTNPEKLAEPPKSYSPPGQEELAKRPPAKPRVGPGHAIVPVVTGTTFDDQDEYEEIARLFASFVRVEREKAAAVARALLPKIIGDKAYGLLALDLNNAEFDRLPVEVQEQLKSAIKESPSAFGYKSYDDFERAMEAGVRLSLKPEINVLMPFRMPPNNTPSTYALPIRIRP